MSHQFSRARVVFTNKQMEAYQVEGDVGEGISRILQDYIENEERQSWCTLDEAGEECLRKEEMGEIVFGREVGRRASV